MKRIFALTCICTLITATYVMAYQVISEKKTDYGHSFDLECDDGADKTISYWDSNGYFIDPTGRRFNTLDQAARYICHE